MRCLVLSDIHANIDALDSVLGDAARHGDLPLLLLGDLVGYGAEPNAVVDRLRDLHIAAAIRGNHDRAACGLDDGDNFNEVARTSAAATGRVLTARNRDYLRALAPGPVAVSDVTEICHGTPFDEDAYVFDEMDAVYALRAASRPICLFGHTHSPFGARLRGEDVEFLDIAPGTPAALADADRLLVNVGSVGQPRDGDARAAYGILDEEAGTVTCYRVEYPIDLAQARIRDAGLPEALAKRLGLGR
jgi:diadenosine tetraphosphatase ApaH/serine/threonine PP2A family protein phosphatase